MVGEHAVRLAAALIQVTGDIATAEDLVQDAVLVALERRPRDGIPERPDAWLFTGPAARARPAAASGEPPAQAGAVAVAAGRG